MKTVPYFSNYCIFIFRLLDCPVYFLMRLNVNTINVMELSIGDFTVLLLKEKRIFLRIIFFSYIIAR